MKNLLIILSLLTLTGCAESKLHSSKSLGKTIEVRPVATSFNEAEKTQIITERGSIFLYGYPMVELGKESHASYYYPASRFDCCWFYFEGSNRSYPCVLQ